MRGQPDAERHLKPQPARVRSPLAPLSRSDVLEAAEGASSLREVARRLGVGRMSLRPALERMGEGDLYEEVREMALCVSVRPLDEDRIERTRAALEARFGWRR